MQKKYLEVKIKDNIGIRGKMMGGSSTILKLLEYGVMGLHGKDREWLKRYVAALAVR